MGSVSSAHITQCTITYNYVLFCGYLYNGGTHMLMQVHTHKQPLKCNIIPVIAFKIEICGHALPVYPTQTNERYMIRVKNSP